MAQKKNLKQKLAVAMSVVNAMNAAAAVALPYVNMTPNVVADGAKVQRLVDGVAGAMYGTAHAEDQVITGDNTASFPREPMVDGDTQTIRGGTGKITTMNGGTQSISAGKGEIENMNGGVQEILAPSAQTSAAKGQVNHFNSGAVIIQSGNKATATIAVWNGGTLKLKASKINNLDLANGVVELMGAGTPADPESATGTTLNQGGTLIVNNGGTVNNTTDNGGVLELHGGAHLNGGTTYSNYVLNGGTLRLVDGASIDNYTINNGTLELGADGKATGTVLYGNGGNAQEIIKNGGLSERAFVDEGGTQTIENGGTSKQATINGGTQTIQNGGLSQQATLNGGLQTIEKGGVSEKITLNGGTLNVYDYAKAQIDAATGGTLNLFDTGLATAKFGNATTVANFTLTNLNASNDTVILGMGNDATAVVGKNLTIGTMEGNAKFVINTDIAKNKSDTITINNVTGTSQNTVRINYDPTLATNKTVPTNTLVATVKAGTATFTGVESTVGGFVFTPLITSKGNSWYITGFENTGSSAQMYAALSNATWQAIAWRDSNFVIGSRMAQLHHNPESAHQNDFWVDFTRGRNRTNNFGHGVNRTYDRVSVGYDRLVGHGWTVGLAYGYEKGTEGYEKGSGDSTGNVVTAYATWQGANGNYVDMTIKGGQLESDFTVQDDNQVTPSKADTRATGAGVSAVYGHRFENASAFYVEPHAGFYWSHLGGYDYRLSDGSDVSVDGCNSFVGNLGVNVGKRLGKGEVYARADFMHDFSGNVRVSMTKAGLNNTMENPLHDSWLNVAVGYRQNYDRVGWYAEAGCQSIGSRESSGDWVWKAGVEFKF